MEEIVSIPIKSKEYEKEIWSFSKIFFSNNRLEIKKYLNEKFPKYDFKEIKTILKQYENQEKVINNETMILINKLFLCSISGSKNGKKHFNNVALEYKYLDGAFKEEYIDLKKMLSEWESRH